MDFVTRIDQYSHHDLKAMINGFSKSLVSDMDFLDTLAAHKCFVIAPWVVRAGPSGSLARVARVIYDIDGNIDKPRVLLHVARELRRAKKRAEGFGGRFAE